jgi:chromosome segregation ATPase
MKLKLLLGLCGLGLAVALGGLYLSRDKMATEVAQLRTQNQELQEQRTAAEEAASAQAKNTGEELERLRKDNEELLRLRNEVRQLRDEKTQLGRQVQTAQAQAQNAQAQAQNAQAQSAQAQAQAEALRRAAAQAPSALSPEQAQAHVCMNNIRQIELAKQQWSVAYNRPVGTAMSAADLATYLPNNTLPNCPSGGVYTLNAVGVAAACNFPGHALFK